MAIMKTIIINDIINIQKNKVKLYLLNQNIT